MSGRLGGGLFGGGRSGGLTLLFLAQAPESSLHAIRNAGRQFVGPERNGGWTNADRSRGRGRAAAKEFDRFGLVHGSMLMHLLQLAQVR